MVSIAEMIFWIGSSLGIILAFIKLHEFFSNKPKLFIAINGLSTEKKSKYKFILNYDFNILNLGKKVALKLSFGFFDGKLLSRVSYPTNKFFVVKKDDTYNIKGIRTIGIPKNDEGEIDFPVDLVIFLTNPKKIYLKKHIKLHGGVGYSSTVGKYDF